MPLPQHIFTSVDPKWNYVVRVGEGIRGVAIPATYGLAGLMQNKIKTIKVKYKFFNRGSYYSI